MKKYIIISLFLLSCTKYRVYNLETKVIHNAFSYKDYKNGDTVEIQVNSGKIGTDYIYKNQKVLILNKVKLWK